ncbi:MAG: hypothetical protein M1832_002142 [Thelocarpon impressellum]|nr:MAG: hypothetical protein M1832_002142 [Thelocarpon impressellum]
MHSYHWVNATGPDGADPATVTADLATQLVNQLAFSAKGDRLIPYDYGLTWAHTRGVNFPYITALGNSSCVSPPYINTRLTGHAEVAEAVYNATSGLITYIPLCHFPGINTCKQGGCSQPGETDLVDAPNGQGSAVVRNALSPLVKNANGSERGIRKKAIKSKRMASATQISQITPERLSTLLLAQHQTPTSSTTTKEGDEVTTTAPAPTPSAEGEKPKIAIIDVRDDDHIGGHIPQSLHFPSKSSSDAAVKAQLVAAAEADVVVFHCSLSKQRGPNAAARYKAALEKEGSGAKKAQEVLVLEGGFVKWQERYGPDGRLTEGWVKDVWEGFEG